MFKEIKYISIFLNYHFHFLISSLVKDQHFQFWGGSQIIEIMQKLFIYNSYISSTNIVHYKHIWHTNLWEDVELMCHLFIHWFVFHLSTHLSMCQMCFQHIIFVCKMYELMNEWTNFARFSLLIHYMLNLWCATLNLHYAMQNGVFILLIHFDKILQHQFPFHFFITHYNPYMFITINICHLRQKWLSFLFHHLIKYVLLGSSKLQWFIFCSFLQFLQSAINTL